MPKQKAAKPPKPVRHPTELSKQERLSVLMDMLDVRRRGIGHAVTIPAWLERLRAETRGGLPSTKTLHRDMAQLAHALSEQHEGNPVLTFDAQAQSWNLAFSIARSEVEVPTCMSLVRSDATVTTLFLAMRAAEQFSHTPMYGPMQAMLAQMTGELPATQRKRLERLAGQIHFTGPAFYPLAPEIFEPLLAGLDCLRKVEIAYRNLQGIESRRTLSPLGLVVVDRAWHVVAVDSKSGQVRDFRLSRIWEAQLLDDTFAPPQDFELKKYLQEGFAGLGHAGKQVEEVLLRFTQEGAAIACDDVLWHPTQSRKTQPDGSVELRFQTTALFQVAHQVMAYAGFVEVVSPKGLRQDVQKRAQALLQMHK